MFVRQVVVSGGEAGGVSLMSSVEVGNGIKIMHFSDFPEHDSGNIINCNFSEVFNGTSWENSDDLIKPRLNHGAVSLPAGRLVCL